MKEQSELCKDVLPSRNIPFHRITFSFQSAKLFLCLQVLAVNHFEAVWKYNMDVQMQSYWVIAHKPDSRIKRNRCKSVR
jgi:hypothetical protein